MDPTVERVQPPAFEDGLGRRYTVDAGGESLEVLTVRHELASAPSFEFAVRERSTRLSGFLRACYGHVRSVERVEAEAPALAVVSERTKGTRLSVLLSTADLHAIEFEIDAALCLTRQVVQAVALLHEHVPDVAHGAIAPERLVVTPNARLVVVDYVFGAALAELALSRERYWKELRVVLPAGAGAPRLDRRADVAQVGAVALAAILGRPLREDEYPARIGGLIQEASATVPGGREPLSPGLRAWLKKALQMDPRGSFASAIDASAELERVLNDSDYTAAPAALQAFLAKCRAVEGKPAPLAVAPKPAPAAAPADAPKPAPEPLNNAPVPAAFPVSTAPPVPVAAPSAPATAAVAPAPKPMPAPPAPAQKAPWPAASVLAGKPPAPAATIPSAVTSVPSGSAPAAATESAAARQVVPEATAVRAETNARPTVSSGALAASSKPMPGRLAPPDLMFEAEASAAAMPPPSRAGRSRNWMIGAAVALIAMTSGVTLATRHLFGPSADSQKPGTLTVTTSTAGVLVVVDGFSRGRTPLTTSIAPGEHVVELVTEGGRRKLPITMNPGGSVSQFVEVAAAAANTGKVHVRTDPAGARVSVDGNYFGSSPITVDGLSPGVHSVQVGENADVITERVTIEAGATAAVVVPLRSKAALAAGWISVKVPVEVQLFENRNLIGTSRTSRIMVPPGRHQLDLVNEALGYRSTHVIQVEPGGEASVRPAWPKGTLALNALPWAEVRIDGDRVGETPIGSVSLPIGPHEVVFRHPQLGEQRHQVVITAKGPARLSVDLRKR